MKRKTVFQVVAIVTLAVGIFYLEYHSIQSRGTEPVTKIVPAFDLQSAQKIMITRMLDSVVLERQADGHWTLTAPRAAAAVADPLKVQMALEILDDLKTRTIAARNADNYPQWQVNELGTHLQVWDKAGKELADIYLGNMAADMVSTYVRREGDVQVYQVTGYLAGEFPATIAPWRLSY